MLGIAIRQNRNRFFNRMDNFIAVVVSLSSEKQYSCTRLPML